MKFRENPKKSLLGVVCFIITVNSIDDKQRATVDAWVERKEATVENVSAAVDSALLTSTP